MSFLSYLDDVSSARPRAPGRAIGLFGWNIPVELVLAADAVPVRVGIVPGETALADRFLESSFSAESRAVAQQWLSGQLDSLDAVVFSRSDDNAQRLYYYLCELQRIGECRGPKPLLYDVAGIARSTSVAHTIESTKSLADALGVQTSRLAAAVQRVANRRALLFQLQKLRASEAVPLGSLANRIVRASRADWSAEFDHALQAWLASPEVIPPQRRILLVGSAPTIEQLHASLEASNAIIVGEINEPNVGSEFNAAVTATTIEAVAEGVHQQTRAARSLWQSPADIARIAKDLRADAVIVWMLATDTGLAWQAPRVEQALRDAQLPVMMLTSQPDAFDASTLAQATQFTQTLEAR